MRRKRRVKDGHGCPHDRDALFDGFVKSGFVKVRVLRQDYAPAFGKDGDGNGVYIAHDRYPYGIFGVLGHRPGKQVAAKYLGQFAVGRAALMNKRKRRGGDKILQIHAIHPFIENYRLLQYIMFLRDCLLFFIRRRQTINA
jgi:hypothetical protein